MISDSGNDRAVDDLAQVTDPFYTTKTYGTGLGLTLVEQIIKQHNGELSISRNSPCRFKNYRPPALGIALVSAHASRRYMLQPAKRVPYRKAYNETPG